MRHLDAVKAAAAPLPAGCADAATDEAVASARRQMLLDFFALLDRESIAYVVLSGYEGYPDRIDSDVDFMVSEPDFARLPTLLGRADAIPGARLIQMLQHETTACYYVFAKPVGAHLAYLHPDASASYRRRGRLWLQSGPVLASRRRAPAGFWVPAAAVEFEYYLVKRIDKVSLAADHLARLAALMREDEPACQATLVRLLGMHRAAALAHALAAGDVAWFAANLAALRRALARSAPLEPLGQRLRHRLANTKRLMRRVSHPTGLVIAVLGPDGSGKTTIIEHLVRELAPAFRQVRRFHLRPHFGKAAGSGGAPVTDPHGQAPRGALASTLKALLFLVDYWWSWLLVVWPAKICSTLLVFDRYYHDMLVDPRRYRLPPALRVQRWLTRLIPEPDLWLVLHAPASVLVARKGEITPEAASELCQRYAALAARMPRALVVPTCGSVGDTFLHASGAVCDALVLRPTRVLGGFR